MISVCIPVYNYPVVPLAETVARQAKELDVKVEVVCIDDCSSEEYKEKNNRLDEYGKYVQLERNVGRARIRNLFLQQAMGDWLLFLDNDSELPEGFMRRYAEELERDCPVVVGGRVYDGRGNDAEHALRYRYGVKMESHSAARRSRHPYRAFMTNNFMVQGEVLQRVGFDESLCRYGHEDTLFGYRLQQEGIAIRHIDNPVVNGEVESNAVFLEKSREAVENLVALYRKYGEDKQFCRSIRLLQAYTRVCALGQTDKLGRAFAKHRTRIEGSLLEGAKAPLWVFSFYKLGLFINCLEYEEQ